MGDRVVVTGGAGFIGSHLADALVARGDDVHVVDNLATGRREQVPAGATFHELDVSDVDALVALATLHDTPEQRMRSGAAISASRLGADLVSAWQHPGTRLGLWTHFTTQFPGTVFALIWGYPFLVAGEGLS